jgi:acetolactate decarboxylase
MRRTPIVTVLVLALLGLLASACSSTDDDAASTTTVGGTDSTTTTTGPREDERVWQVGTITALSAGGYDGVAPVGDLVAHGDLGLGTFDALDGEMVIVDGTVWQVPVDGVPVEADADLTTPFAQVTAFEADRTLEIADPVSCDELKATVDGQIDPAVELAALRVHGTFALLQTRSVPAQQAPFPPLDAVVPARQVTFDLTEVDATMVGFRTADELESVSPPGYHFHSLTDDEQGGGHVLDCQLTRGTVEIDLVTDLQLAFDPNP